MSGNKVLGLQKKEEFIEKPVRACFYKLLQVVDIIKVKNARAAVDAKVVLNDVASVIPEV